jgi:hypothetical protein
MDKLREWVEIDLEKVEVMIEGRNCMTHKIDCENMDLGRPWKRK